MHAASGNHLDIINQLLAYEGMDINAERQGLYALRRALRNENLEIFRTLWEQSINRYVQFDDGSTILMHAIGSQQFDQEIKMLVSDHQMQINSTKI